MLSTTIYIVGCFFVSIKRKHYITAGSLQAQLSSSPVSSLGVVSDLVVSSQPDPLGERSVLLRSLGELLLDLKSLVGRHF